VPLAQEKSMEYIERTEVAGNKVNLNTNQQEKNMTQQTEQTVESNIPTITINIPVKELMDRMIKEGNLINIIVEDSEFDIAVEEILTDKGEEAIEQYISNHPNSIADSIEANIKDMIDSSIDLSEVADNVEYEIDWSGKVQNEVESMMQSYSAGSTCSIAKAAAVIIIDTIRYDLVSHLREDQNFPIVYSETITNSLTKFIDKRIEVRLNEEKEQYLKNKQEYMQETADKLNQPVMKVEEFKAFINGLDLYQETKNRILREFDEAMTQLNNK
jgi:ASC-1-like (ASCH) protein